MALETLMKIGPTPFVEVDHDKNSIKFTIQKGPIKENGVNGCQIDELIRYGRHILVGLDRQFGCQENLIAINGLDSAIIALDLRKRDRESRGVEGTNNA